MGCRRLCATKNQIPDTLHAGSNYTDTASECIVSSPAAHFVRYLSREGKVILKGTDSVVKVREEVGRSAEHPRDNRQDGHVPGSLVSTLYMKQTILGLTQQSTSTESSDHFLGFPPSTLSHPRLACTPPCLRMTSAGS